MNYIKYLTIMIVSILLMTSSAGVISAKKDKITDTLRLDDKYKLHLEEVDVDGSHAWILLIQNNTNVDNLIVSVDEHFELYDGDVLIVDGNCSAIFAVLESCVIKLENVKQYDKNGNIIFSQDIVLLGT